MDNKKALTASGGLRIEKNQQNQQKNKQKEKNIETKRIGPSFNLPYDQNWTQLNKLHSGMILEELTSTLQNTFCDQWLLKKKRKLKMKHKELNEEDIIQILFKLVENNTRYKDYDNETITNQTNEIIKINSFTQYLLLGINNVTRYIEKSAGTLSLLLVCRSAEPGLMTRHLLCQSLYTDTPVCALDNLSQSVSPVLDVKSVLALGFKCVPNNPLENLIDFIKDKIPNVDNNWVKLWKKKNSKKHNTNDEKHSINNTKEEEKEERQDDNLSEKEIVKRKRNGDSTTSNTLNDMNIKWKEMRPKKKKVKTGNS